MALLPSIFSRSVKAHYWGQTTEGEFEYGNYMGPFSHCSSLDQPANSKKQATSWDLPYLIHKTNREIRRCEAVDQFNNVFVFEFPQQFYFSDRREVDAFVGAFTFDLFDGDHASRALLLRHVHHPECSLTQPFDYFVILHRT